MSMSSWKTRAFAALLGIAAGTALGLLHAPHALAGDWRWPVQGRVASPYSNDNARPYSGGMHRGIDVAAPLGTAVIAARAGAVTYAGALGYAGLVVAVRTADGRYLTSYLHLREVSVRRGVQVDAGERIGAVGTTGRRSIAEPHLHFGVRLAGEENQYVNPLELLPPLAASPRGSVPVPPPAPVPVRPQLAPVPVRSRPPAVAHPSPAAPRGRALPLPARRPAAVARPLPVRAPHPLGQQAGYRPAPGAHRPVRAGGHGPQPVPAGPRSAASAAAGPAHPRAGPAPAPLVPAGPPAEWGRFLLAGALLALVALAWARPLRRLAAAAPRRAAGVAAAMRSLAAGRRTHGAREAAPASAAAVRVGDVISEVQ
jgi:hypothetical protein